MSHEEIDPTILIEQEEAIDVVAPVDPRLGKRFMTLLQSHGAQVTKEGKAREMRDARGKMRRVVDYRIRFPLGTLKQQGMLISSKTEHFTMVFPDGFKLKGMEQWTVEEGQRYLFFLPKEDSCSPAQWY